MKKTPLTALIRSTTRGDSFARRIATKTVIDSSYKHHLQNNRTPIESKVLAMQEAGIGNQQIASILQRDRRKLMMAYPATSNQPFSKTEDSAYLKKIKELQSDRKSTQQKSYGR